MRQHEYCLVTVHRAKNTENPKRIENIFDALISLNKTIKVVMPLHPRTRKTLKNLGLIETVEKSFQVIEPLGYLDMLCLEKNSKLILTDSGGIQKEAYFLEIPCVVLRDETEWIELLDVGWNILASPQDPNSLANNIQHHLHLDTSKLRHPHFYGNGIASDKILDSLKYSDI